MKRVYDTMTDLIYDSIADTARKTGYSSRDIKADCERFHENNKIMPRFVYTEDFEGGNV